MERSFGLAKDKRGVALVIALLVMGVLLLLGTAFMTISSTETQIAYNERNSVQAFYVAEAGVQYALNQIKANTASSPGYYNNSSNLTSTSASFGLGSYTYTLAKLGDDSNGNAILNVASTGTVSAAKRVISVRMEPTYDSRYRDAAHGRDRVELDSNAEMDSYDSTVGAYRRETRRSNGSVSVDATGTAVIRLDGNAKVNGSALAGPGADTVTAIRLDSNAQVTGSLGTEQDTLSMPDVAPPSGVVNSGDLRVGSNQTVTLGNDGQTTTLLYNQVDLNSNVRLNIQGKVIIYVVDRFEADSNVVINGNVGGRNPANLEIRVVGSTDDAAGNNRVRLDSNVVFYGTVYAPRSRIRLDSNVEVYGSLVGMEVRLDSNVRVHYDETLGGRKDNFSGYKITAWQEVRSQ